MFQVVDLFSGGGGASCGFARHPSFAVRASADAEKGKPTSGTSLQCNITYKNNIGIEPQNIDLAVLDPKDIRNSLGLRCDEVIDVLVACPPCTGFSRTNPNNHLSDDPRNSLVVKVADFAQHIKPKVIFLENARELVMGRFSHHADILGARLKMLGYEVAYSSHMLDRFGLPQRRERAVLLAVKRPLNLRRLEDLWAGYRVRSYAVSVRSAISEIPGNEELDARCPGFSSAAVERRIQAIPPNGGSWIDLTKTDEGAALLTDSMRRILQNGKTGSHPDVYGRMSWERPAPTIKRECAHVGNGRYAHPEENRLCTIGEMARLNGFPSDYIFEGVSLSNAYRQVGDAVPPLVSYQVAWLANWILTGAKPSLLDAVLPKTSLRRKDIENECEELNGSSNLESERGGSAPNRRVA